MTREEQRAKAAHEYIQSDSVAAGNEVLAFGDFIEGAKWADSHPHWIPVEERLPEVGEKVIFYSPGIDDWLSGAFQQDGTWWNEEYGTHFYGVTHWMPIVPPRKEEDNE